MIPYILFLAFTHGSLLLTAVAQHATRANPRPRSPGLSVPRNPSNMLLWLGHHLPHGTQPVS